MAYICIYIYIYIYIYDGFIILDLQWVYHTLNLSTMEFHCPATGTRRTSRAASRRPGRPRNSWPRRGWRPAGNGTISEIYHGYCYPLVI